MCATTPIDYSDRLLTGHGAGTGASPIHLNGARHVAAPQHAAPRHSACVPRTTGFPHRSSVRLFEGFPAADTASRQHQRQTDAGRYGEPHVTKPRFIRTAAAVATLAAQRCRARAVESHAVRRARRRRAIPDACRRAPLGRSTAELRHPAFPDRDERSRGSRRRLACAVQARTGLNLNDGTATVPGYASSAVRTSASVPVGTVTLGRQFSVLFDKTLFYDPLWYASYSGQASSCR